MIISRQLQGCTYGFVAVQLKTETPRLSSWHQLFLRCRWLQQPAVHKSVLRRKRDENVPGMVRAFGKTSIHFDSFMLFSCFFILYLFAELLLFRNVLCRMTLFDYGLTAFKKENKSILSIIQSIGHICAIFIPMISLKLIFNLE